MQTALTPSLEPTYYCQEIARTGLSTVAYKPVKIYKKKVVHWKWIIAICFSSIVFALSIVNCSFHFLTDAHDSTNPQRVPGIRKILASMTLEEKVGQMFIISTYDPRVEESRFGLHPNVAKLIKEIKPGGILLFGRDFRSSAQVQELVLAMQSLSKIGLFIASDEEGESVRRTTLLEDPRITPTPDMQVIGETNNPDAAYQVAKIIGNEISSLGINMVLAPIADVNSNPDNLFLGPRAFGTTPQIVSPMVAAFCKGLESERIFSILKHYPGHGDTIGDTHAGTVTTPKTLKELQLTEFPPFQAGIDAGCSGILTAHIIATKVGNSRLPATFSPLLLQYLRNSMGFKGLIITDSLEMKAISDYYTPAQSVIFSIKAGADILLLPMDIPAVKQAIIDAVLTGELTEKRIDESVARILYQKKKYGLIIPPQTLPKLKDNSSHIAFIKKTFPDFLP